MKYVWLVLRSLFGLLFAFSGVSKLFHLMPPPEPGSMPDAAMQFSTALASSGYMMPLVGATELVAGLMLLSGFFVPLGLTLLGPIVVNIFLFHVFLAPQGTIIGIVVVLIEVALAWRYKDAFRSVLQLRS